MINAAFPAVPSPGNRGFPRVDHEGAGHEADEIAAWRWWPRDELAPPESRDGQLARPPIWPAELPALLERLLGVARWRTGDTS